MVQNATYLQLEAARAARRAAWRLNAERAPMLGAEDLPAHDPAMGYRAYPSPSP